MHSIWNFKLTVFTIFFWTLPWFKLYYNPNYNPCSLKLLFNCCGHIQNLTYRRHFI